MIRLRQLALVARDLESARARIGHALGVTVSYRDPGVAAFGLENVLFTIGDQFLEIVSPAEEGTTAGRLLDKRFATDTPPDEQIAGYMAIYEVDDLDQRLVHLAASGVRFVWSADLADIRARHLHPADVGGAIVSLDQPAPQGSWKWGGPTWCAHQETSIVTGIAGFRIGARDPGAMQTRWDELGFAHAVDFAQVNRDANDSPAQAVDSIDEIHVVAADRGRAGTAIGLGAVTIRLV